MRGPGSNGWGSLLPRPQCENDVLVVTFALYGFPGRTGIRNLTDFEAGQPAEITEVLAIAGGTNRDNQEHLHRAELMR